MKRFADYILTEKIDETRNSVIYRGHRENDLSKAIIKVLKTTYPTASEIARFRHECDLIRKLDIQGIVKIVDLVEQDNTYAIIEEDFDAVSLKDMIHTKKIDLKDFLRIAATISETLALIHKNNIIHLDIKPANILINAEQYIVKIADFGIAAALTHAYDELYHPEVISGTLAYMSPEQTGRMNRSVDYRTDIYSLGITFYEMLAGDLPFQSRDPMELIHAHMAKMPIPPVEIDPSMPQVVSDLVLKLMSKTPEERYQSSKGLAADIQECLVRLKEKNRIDPFPLGEKDFSIRFNVPQIMVGRDNELGMLMSSFEETGRGEGGMMLVLGHPGIGKSALISEIYKPIVARKGYFISGKYDQFKKDIPYSAIIQSFQDLIRQVISESGARLQSWKDRIIASLGPNGRVICAVIPELEMIIGPQPPVPDLPPEESQNRFNMVFNNFVSVFTTEEHPLAIFLDDLQWADLASLNLMKMMISGRSGGYLLLIGAYRDNEVDGSHPLSITLDDIRKTNGKVNAISLGPLSAASVNQMIMHVLRCSADGSISLAQLIHKKTGGNPFFVIQFLKSLYDSKRIQLNAKGGWERV